MDVSCRSEATDGPFTNAWRVGPITRRRLSHPYRERRERRPKATLSCKVIGDRTNRRSLRMSGRSGLAPADLRHAEQREADDEQPDGDAGGGADATRTGCRQPTGRRGCLGDHDGERGGHAAGDAGGGARVGAGRPGSRQRALLPCHRRRRSQTWSLDSSTKSTVSPGVHPDITTVTVPPGVVVVGVTVAVPSTVLVLGLGNHAEAEDQPTQAAISPSANFFMGFLPGDLWPMITG